MTVRLGLVAASRIADLAVIQPVAHVDGVEVTAVAARDGVRATAAARQWDLEHAYGSYREMIEADTVDAVYIGTPPAIHRRWAVAAIEAGKHVLCEKPLASNADDGRVIAEAASRGSVVAMEAMHWRYHPLVALLEEALAGIGPIRHVDATFEVEAGRIVPPDIRWLLDLGGGAMMDLGVYPISWARWAVPGEPVVVGAEAGDVRDGVDGSMEARLEWASGATGRVMSSMVGRSVDHHSTFEANGERGTLRVTSLVHPQRGATAEVDVDGSVDPIAVPAGTTYQHQLVAFRDAIVSGRSFPTTIEDGVRTMEVLDECYRLSGLGIRPTHPA